MGRDKVLGLSLAILLIGFAGAFCFRNEPFVENGLKLARAKILDEGIAKRPGPKPYVAEGKSDPAPASKPTVTLGASEAIEPVESPRTVRHSPRETPSASPSKSPSDIADSQSVPKARFVSVEKDRSTPEPVSTEPVSKPVGPSASAISVLDKPLELTIRPSSRAFDSPDSLLEDSKTWQHRPEGRDGCPAMTGISTEPAETGDTTTDPTTQTDSAPSKTYTVRRGDTLSKIAQHFLGDSNRYRDIFEANRDQLQSQNARLNVGMTLRIPADRPRSKRLSGSTVSQSKPARTTNSVGGAPRTRQVPARPVARTRELSKQQPPEKASSSHPTSVEPEEPMGTPRFLPVTKGPFWRSRDDSGSTKTGSRDLSQRPPALEKKNRVSDDDTSSAAPETKPKADDNSTMSSEGSEGM